jgi:phage terminase large subunit-like protein
MKRPAAMRAFFFNRSNPWEHDFHANLIQMTAKHNGNMAVTVEPDRNHKKVMLRRQAAHNGLQKS